jgi:hypothetical protein
MTLPLRASSAFTIPLASRIDFAGWREAARRLCLAGIAPEQVVWRVVGESASDLFGGETALPVAPEGVQLTVPSPSRENSSSAPKRSSAIQTATASRCSTGFSGGCSQKNTS